MYFLLNMGIFQCHVSFQGCNGLLVGLGKKFGRALNHWFFQPSRRFTTAKLEIAYLLLGKSSPKNVFSPIPQGWWTKNDDLPWYTVSSQWLTSLIVGLGPGGFGFESGYPDSNPKSHSFWGILKESKRPQNQQLSISSQCWSQKRLRVSDSKSETHIFFNDSWTPIYIYYSWWLNQPIWKICSSKWVHLPQFSGWR